MRKGVSIPSWVFWSSRRHHGSRLIRIHLWFQSRLGFSGRLDDIERYDLDELELFQSRLGFSGRLDKSALDTSDKTQSGFNPVLGFLVVSTS